MSVFTDNIEKILIEKRIGKYEFYEAVGISAVAFGQWKNGKNKPRMKNIESIAEYLGVPVADLLGQEKKTAAPQGNGLSDAQVELLTLSRQLDDDSLRYLLTKARELAEFQRFRETQ